MDRHIAYGKRVERLVIIAGRAGVEGRHDLSRAIRPKVEEDQRVAVGDRTRGAHNGRFDELVVFAAIVAGAHRFLRVVCAMLGTPVGE